MKEELIELRNKIIGLKKEPTGYPSIDKTHEEGYSYFKLHPIIPNLSIANAVDLINLFNGNQDAVDSIYLSVNYRELQKNSDILAKSFKELGVRAGDIVTVCMDNTYQAILVFLAANKIGAITTFLNYRESKHEIKNYLNLFESPILVNFNKDSEYNEEIKRDTKVRNIITLDEKDLYTKDFNEKDNTKLYGYSDFITFNDLGIISSFQKGPINKLYGKNRDALLLYTSGSSGNPKTVVLTNENVLANGIYCKSTINLPQDKNERCLSFVPFKYPYGFATSVLLTFLCGRTVVVLPEGLTRENAKDALKNINYYYGSPALVDVLKNTVPDDVDLSSGHTFVTGGDFWTEKTEKTANEFFKKHNNDRMIYCNGAGNAETVATWSSSVGTPIKKGTVGKILVGSDPIVVDSDTMQEVKYGEEGTLLISGKHVFREYYNNPELTNKEIVNINGKRYYNTRTIGSLDEDRYFKLTGRESRFYILNDGNKVYCEKIQNFISLIDVVESCVVVPKPNDETRFSGKAYIVLKNGIDASDEVKKYIIDECSKEYILQNGEKKSIASFEIPSDIEFVDKIQLTDADKIDYLFYENEANNEYEKEKSKSLKLKK
ncbi:MAG: class I adenylate-forming enzyme family protein [bacterium]|nr:class I adenylate-forming enzyme family protein [bacterium]